jgi:hypothetical protein
MKEPRIPKVGDQPTAGKTSLRSPIAVALTIKAKKRISGDAAKSSEDNFPASWRRTSNTISGNSAKITLNVTQRISLFDKKGSGPNGEVGSVQI